MKRAHAKRAHQAAAVVADAAMAAVAVVTAAVAAATVVEVAAAVDATVAAVNAEATKTNYFSQKGVRTRERLFCFSQGAILHGCGKSLIRSIFSAATFLPTENAIWLMDQTQNHKANQTTLRCPRFREIPREQLREHWSGAQ